MLSLPSILNDDRVMMIRLTTGRYIIVYSTYNRLQYICTYSTLQQQH
jgi:hypothetical protein